MDYLINFRARPCEIVYVATGEARPAPGDCEVDVPDGVISTQFSANDTKLRQLNRATVEKYLSTTPEDRLQRYRLYTRDGSAALFYTDIGKPIIVCGHEKLKKHGELSLRVLPDWVWTDVRIYETQDANRFWVECGGAGTILFPGYPAGHYRNHFIHSFVLDDGKIVASREYANPIEQMRALSIETPRIKRDWIPT